MKEHEEWSRRQETGYVPDYDEDEPAFAKEELEGGEDGDDD